MMLKKTSEKWVRHIYNVCIYCVCDVIYVCVWGGGGGGLGGGGDMSSAMK